MFVGASEQASDLFVDLFPNGIDLYVELDFNTPPGSVSSDPAIVVSSRYVLGDIPTIGFCYSDEANDTCSDIVDQSVWQPLLGVDEVTGLTFDEDGMPVAGTLVLGSFTRSPWPTTLTLNFAENTWVFDLLAPGDFSASGNFAAVPLPAGLWLLLSALAVVGCRRSRK